MVIQLWSVGSPNVLKILIALEELELPYELRPVDVLMNEQYRPEFEALTPNRKVPVIHDPEGPDGKPLTLWESGAILLYLSEKTGGRLVPTRAADRHIMMQWLMFQMSGIGPMFGQFAHFSFYAPDAAHAYSRSRYGTEVKRIYDVVERRLSESPYLAGDDYSIADIAAWPWLRNYKMRDVTAQDVPHVARWVKTIRQRPAVEKATTPFDARKGFDIDAFAREHPDKLDRYLGRGDYARA